MPRVDHDRAMANLFDRDLDDHDWHRLKPLMPNLYRDCALAHIAWIDMKRSRMESLGAEVVAQKMSRHQAALDTYLKTLDQIGKVLSND